MKKAFLVFFLTLINFSLFAFSGMQKSFFLYIQKLQDDKNCPLAIRQYVSNMDEKEKIAQLFLVSISGSSIYNSNSDCNNGIAPGGFLFFKFNVAQNAQEVTAFTESINSYYLQKSQIPPFLAIDHEGGAVNRLRTVGSNLSSQQEIAQNYSIEEAKAIYLEQAKLLRTLGFTVNLAPVIEVLDENNVAFLDDRAFGDYEKTVEYGKICVSSYLQEGIFCVLKHFPGNTNDDPHIGIPKIDVSQTEFNQMTKSFLHVLYDISLEKQDYYCNPGLLISHAEVPALYGNIPACFSPKLVNDLLKNQYCFNGLIFSDDVYMAALKKNGYSPEISAKNLVLAGVDVIMMSCQNFSSVLDFLYQESLRDPYLAQRINESACKVISSKMLSGHVKLTKTENPYSAAFEKSGFPKFYKYCVEFQ